MPASSIALPLTLLQTVVELRIRPVTLAGLMLCLLFFNLLPF